MELVCTLCIEWKGPKCRPRAATPVGGRLAGSPLFTVPTTQEGWAWRAALLRCEIAGVELGISPCTTASIKLPSTEAAVPIRPLADSIERAHFLTPRPQ